MSTEHFCAWIRQKTQKTVRQLKVASDFLDSLMAEAILEGVSEPSSPQHPEK